MRFTAVFVASALSAVAVAQSTSASPTQSMDPAQASVIACLDDCSDDDLTCLARCNPVPNPSEDQVIATDKCVGKCDQGKGTDADALKYAECQAKCIAENYYNTSEGTPQATGAAGGSSGSSGNSGSNGSNGNAETTATDSASGAGSTGNSGSDNDDDSSSNGGSGSSGNSGSNGSNDDGETGSATDSDNSATGTGSASEETESDSAAAQLMGSGAAFFALVAGVFAL